MNKASTYKVTIAMPVYNVEDRVAKSLMSALSQTFESIEYLIIDDKGTDKSIEVVKEVISRHPRGKYVKIIDHGINRGTGATKNTSIDNATGEYLFFMDSDDYITPNCIEQLYKKIKETNAEVVAGGYALLNEDFTYNTSFYLGNINKGRTLSEHVYIHKGFWNVQTWNKLYKLSFLKEKNIRCIPHHLCEDVFFQYQVILNCKRFAVCNNITYLYILYNNSATAGGTGYKLKFAQQFGEALYEKFKYLQTASINIDKIFVANEIISGYKFLFSRIRLSTYITKEEKNDIIIKIALDFDKMLKSQIFERYKYLTSVVNSIIATQNTLPFENTKVVGKSSVITVGYLLSKFITKTKKSLDKKTQIKDIIYFIQKL